VPYNGGERLPAERASRLGHLDVLRSPLVKKLCESFEDGSVLKPAIAEKWQPIRVGSEPLAFIFGVDGSMQPINGETKPYKALAFVKTALVMLDQPALGLIDKAEPHPFMIRDILERSQVYHATVFPLRYVEIPGQKLYHAVRQVIFDSLRDPSLDGEVYETFKWLAYEKWDQQKRSLPEFECPHCQATTATLPHDSDNGPCPTCGKEILVTDMLGFHQIMAEDAAPDSVATDYMSIHENLLLFTGIRHYWENQRTALNKSLFIKDGPLSIRAQYSKLVNPIRRFLSGARKQGIEICILGQEKSGAFWEHLQLIGDDAPEGTFFVPDHTYIREHVQHRPVAGAEYGKDTNYGAKIFVKLDSRYKFVLNVPNGETAHPQSTNLIGIEKIFGTLPTILSSRYEDGLLPVELAHSVASLSTYPSAKVLSMFAEAVNR
jgi:ribosomal protein S27E